MSTAPHPRSHRVTPSPDRLLLGLDIGGTKSLAALARAERPLEPLLVARAGSANVQNVSRDTARAALAEIADRLAEEEPGWREAVAAVAVGSGGVDTEKDARALSALVSEATGLDESLVSVVHDTRLILAAGGHDTGVGVILGTGSVAWGRNEQGETERSGGWGYLLGDEGSAYWFGREAVRAALGADELDEEDPIIPLMLEFTGVSEPQELIAEFYSDPSRTRWAQCARLVFTAREQGSERAAAILEAAVELVAESVTSVGDRLQLEGPIVFGGGLVQNQPLYAERLRERISVEGFTPIQVLDDEPVIGALRLAAKRLGAAAAEG